jgi:hypothetical protein
MAIIVQVEQEYGGELSRRCRMELLREREMQSSWFNRSKPPKKMKMPACDKLDEFRRPRKSKQRDKLGEREPERRSDTVRETEL